MPTFIIITAETPNAFTKSLQVWENPHTIQDFWFGDSPTNSRAKHDVFPDTPAAHKAIDAWLAQAAQVKKAQDELQTARHELLNAKVRGELEKS